MTREEIDAIERANGDGVRIGGAMDFVGPQCNPGPPGPVAPPPAVVALDDDVLALVASYAQQAAAAEGAKQGAVALFMRQRGLQGEWRISPNGRELVRQA